MLLLNIFVLIASSALVYAQLDSTCTTPNGETATCKSIYSCTVLYNVLTTNNTEQLQFIKNSQCGYDQTPLVCCGSYDNFKQKQQRQRQTNSREAKQHNFFNYGSWDESDEEPQHRSSTSSIFDRSNCGIQVGDRILGGQATALSEFPWMALLQYRRRNGSLKWSCGGVLISTQYVLTAAHCVKGQILTKVGSLEKVRLGEHNVNTDIDCISQLGFESCNDRPIDAEVDQVIAHEDYNEQSPHRYNDIALIRLKRPVPTSDFIKPICLPSSSDQSEVGRRVYVAGWGKTEYSNDSPVKLKVQIPIAEQNRCTQQFKNRGVRLSTSQLCAGGEINKDSCSGDSGGPLMTTFKNDSAQWYVEGLVSFGMRCGTAGWPGIYTRVGRFVDWINRNVR